MISGSATFLPKARGPCRWPVKSGTGVRRRGYGPELGWNSVLVAAGSCKAGEGGWGDAAAGGLDAAGAG